MKNTFIVLIAVVAVTVGLTSFFLLKKDSSFFSPENTFQEDLTGQPADEPEQETEQTQEQNLDQIIEENQKIVTDDFSIDLPAGWARAESKAGVLAMAINYNEQIQDPEAQKINFQSYLAVIYDTLQGGSLADYGQTVKSALEQSIPSTVFTKDQDLTINGRLSHAIEAEMTQQGIDLKVLLVVIEGEGDDVWGISFNTVRSNWEGYREAFYNTANSFVVKI